MRIFSYVVEHDLGFAPNPFFGVCSLAACKPEIRKRADLGDIVVGTGAARPGLTNNLIYWMRVKEVCTFDEYWADQKYLRKRPQMNGSRMVRYGDNIYHRDATGSFVQEDSFHSLPHGQTSVGNLNRDTRKTDRVLLASEYAYWGGSGPQVPAHLRHFIKKGPGHKCRFSSTDVTDFSSWLFSFDDRGFLGTPAHWQFL
mgnify:CR=1 FL=1|jgi:hypothetical protein